MFSLRNAVLSCFLFSSLSLLSIENSIVPLIEKMEDIQNLPIQKYSKNQYAEIVSSLNQKEEKIRIVSYNVLFDIHDQKLEEVNRWPMRLSRVVSLIEEMAPDILGVQELYPNQAIDLLPHMDQAYAFYSEPCKDGEMNGIFYRKDRFEVLDSKVWYMTETPEVPSSETLTMIQLKDLKTEKIFAVFNVHLAFGNVDKREFQARFIAKTLKTFNDRIPVILTGDMNTFPNRLDLKKLPFYDGEYIHRIFTQSLLNDAKDVSILGHLGPFSTFTNLGEDPFPFKGTGTPGVFLDHVYVSKGIQVLIHAVEPGTLEGHFPSDHMPILVDFKVE